MAEAGGDLRFEVKFVTRETRLVALEHWIRAHPSGLRRAYPQRRVNNLYLDHPALHAYAEVGAASRAKLRWRWYGTQERCDTSALEVKRRRDRLGWKLRFDAGPLDLRADSWRSHLARLQRELPGEARIWLAAYPHPILLNRYDRSYYVTADGRVRLTVDTRQQVYAQSAAGAPNLTRRAPLHDTAVVEVKFAREDERLGNRFVQGLPIRVSRNSKYAIGVRAVLA